MSGISFSGLGSGIDFGVITDAIIAERTRPVTQMQTRQTEARARAESLKALNARLITLTEAARALTDRDLGDGRSAASSDVKVATVSATDAAVPGDFELRVDRLATPLALASRGFASASAPLLIATPATFELRTGGATTGESITIDSSNNSLAGLRDAINLADAGLSAAVVDTRGDGTNFQLVLTSRATGAAGRVELVETSATGARQELNLQSLNPGVTATDFSALDARLSVGGLAVTRSTNRIADLVPGVTLELKTAGTTNVTVSADTSALGDKLQAFAGAYNAVGDFIAAQYAPDSKGRPGGILAGDPTLRSAQRALREALNSASTANGGALTELTQIGFGRDSAGKLTLDRAKLDEQLRAALPDVRALLAGAAGGATGIAHEITRVSDGFSNDVTGLVKTAIKGFDDTIASLDKSIAAQQDRIEALRKSLQRRFAAADAAINQLNGQGTALTSIIKSLEPRNS